MTDTAPRWAAVVISFNGGELLLSCIQSLLADDSAGRAEIVVVDNGSVDDSVAALRAAEPDVRIIELGKNVGYASAANVGIAAASAPIVAVCNQDLTMYPGTAAALLARFDREPGLGAAGPRILNTDGSTYPSARINPSVPVAVGHGLFVMWWPTNPATRRYKQLGATPSAPRDVDWVSGATIFLRRSALDEVGGWDERYFFYMEDLDLCWRLRGAGWRIAYEPGGEIVHIGGASARRRPYRMLFEHHRSAWRFARRRFTGVKILLLPFAAVYLALRGGLAMAEYAWRASKPAGSSG